MTLLTQGNTAKLYCLNWIAAYAEGKNAVSILDLGSGRSQNFIELLRRYPQVRYVGVEPDAHECAEARRLTHGLNATIIQGFGYDLYGRMVQEKFDLVTSFSVMEHVYERPKYLRAAADCLKPDGRMLINYDAGHFRAPATLRERVKNVVGPILATLGNQSYFQKFVREADFHQWARAAGLTIVEAKSFNTRLKGIYKGVPPEHREAYMTRWLALEEWLNEVTPPYTDADSKTWFTRNFVLQLDDKQKR
jgi:SAM-dependent methyltransferase